MAAPALEHQIPRYRTVLRELLKDRHEVETRDIASDLVDSLTYDELLDLALDLAPIIVRLEIGRMRHEAVGSNVRPAGSSRWKAVAVSQAQVHLNGGYRAIGSLTPDEAERVAEEYDERARANAAWARAMRRLAALARERNVTTLVELGDETIREALPGGAPS